MADEPAEGRRGDADEPRDRPNGPRDDADDEGPADPAPLGDLADRIRRRRGAADDGPDPDRFVRRDAYDASAPERLWTSLDEAPATADAGAGEGPVDPEAAGGGPEPTAVGPGGAAVEAGEGVDDYVVPKRSYCESCEHFGEPPAVHCEHPGTTILEFVDADHVQVRRCPVVAERRASGEFDREAGRRPGPFDRQ